jgi:hypothetical protein
MHPKMWKSLAVGMAALVTLVFTATSAHAAEVRHRGAYAVVYPDAVMSICDTQTDGNGAYVEALLANGTQKKYWDGSGHDGDCGGPFYPPSPILMFKVCEDHAGCSKQTRPSWPAL